MVVGLPKALLYYKYRYLWETFFQALGCETASSRETDREIVENGSRFSIDECCLPAKIYMGHVHSLIGKCDYILVPRIESFGKREFVCVKFNAMYDIVKNTFENANLLDYNVDVIHGESEKSGFIGMGVRLGRSRSDTMKAYELAKNVQASKQRIFGEEQLHAARTLPGLKILLVSHPYNIYDRMLGRPVIEKIEALGGVPLFADMIDAERSIAESRIISPDLLWTYSRELVGAISLYRGMIDGIILLTAFPCGPDSLVNELILRKNKETPAINIILDELQGDAGLQTRIESFMDILSERKKGEKAFCG